VTLELTVVDAFTDRAFSGNPAAVAIVDVFPDDRYMQLVAREMNLSETAFVVARPDGSHDLRWFSPAMEIDLCGHATLASAHVLGGAGRFHTLGGLLTCEPGDDGLIRMDFPADPPVPAEPSGGPAPPGTVEYMQGRIDGLAVLADARSVREFVPDITALAALGTRLTMITAPGDRPGVDCVSRVFAPNAGIAEDPATGSAHCMAAVYWSARTGRTTLVGEQASDRGATVLMELRGDRVVLGGRAVTVSKVSLLV
jgi:predicted PhzF superfamily epimerase YddE/YHI9